LTIGAGQLIGTRLGLASYLRAVPLIVLKGWGKHSTAQPKISGGLETNLPN
jgi:hypothetical protein